MPVDPISLVSWSFSPLREGLPLAAATLQHVLRRAVAGQKSSRGGANTSTTSQSSVSHASCSIPWTPTRPPPQVPVRNHYLHQVSRRVMYASGFEESQW